MTDTLEVIESLCTDSRTMDNNEKCDVCKEEPMVGVAAVPGVPMSVAYGRKCLDANAHPMWVLVANTACVGGYEQAADWWQEMVDDTLSHLGKSREEFDQLVAQSIANERAYFEEQARKEAAGEIEPPPGETPNGMDPF